MSHTNYRWGQILWWPRWTLFFYRGAKRLGPLAGIYRYVVYVWPLEFRVWR
jgi:hypothetical protein